MLPAQVLAQPWEVSESRMVGGRSPALPGIEMNSVRRCPCWHPELGPPRSLGSSWGHSSAGGEKSSTGRQPPRMKPHKWVLHPLHPDPESPPYRK